VEFPGQVTSFGLVYLHQLARQVPQAFLSPLQFIV